jgi:CrcB protein
MKNAPNPLRTGSNGARLGEIRRQGKLPVPLHRRRCSLKAAAMAVPSPLAASLYVALGGGVGAALRYQVGRLFTHWVGPNAVFPWGTLTVNVTGSLAMGLLAGWLARQGSSSPFLGGEQWRLLLGVGMLGGYTTFSAFSLELMLLVERGQPGLAAVYAAASVLPGLAALWLGLVAMRALA